MAKRYEMNEVGEWVFVGMVESLIVDQPAPDYSNWAKNTPDGANDDQQLFD